MVGMHWYVTAACAYQQAAVPGQPLDGILLAPSLRLCICYTGPAANSPAEGSEFGPPTDFNAPSGVQAFGSSAAHSRQHPAETTHGFMPEPLAQPAAAASVYSGASLDMYAHAGHTQQVQLSSGAQQLPYR